MRADVGRRSQSGLRLFVLDTGSRPGYNRAVE